MQLKPAISHWIEHLQSLGLYTFTRAQAESETGRSFVATQTALRRLKEQGRIVSPRRGFYVVVPFEYRAANSPPANWFIDDMMLYLDQPYYVGLLSAAAIHGAAHQQPMVFQVMTNKPTREIRSGKVAIQFSMSCKIEHMPVTEKQTETGTMRVATPETTAFDMVRYQAAAGHLSNAATVLAELAECIDAQALVSIAQLVRLPDVQRLGYLLDAVGESDLAGPLAKWLDTQKPRAIFLHPGESADVKVDMRWHVLPNIELEVDLQASSTTQ
ncbi:MAG: type IV toxin-antitoxin system AbiEi family antitoxin [Deltaproteobacteria bacterium]|nr:type IV toxin-antitoxin system AbiEi family antitoxin [Deltaproteobacteria bacterium]